MTVRAPSPGEAVDKALRIVKRAVPTVMTHQLVKAEVGPMELAEDPEFLGVTELADYLDVSAAALAKLADTPGFPRPLARIRSGPIWKFSTVKRYVSSNG